MRNLIRATLLSGGLLAALAAPAQAATTLGEASSNGTTGCAADYTWVQAATAPGSPSYAVPAGGGVITSWSHEVTSDTPSTATMRLKVFRSTGPMAYLTVGESTVQPLTSPGVQVFPTRISVQAGDLLGLRAGAESTACFRIGQTGDTAENSADADPDPPVGSPFTPTITNVTTALNIAAMLEPDCDSDGFGDETQDSDTSYCIAPDTVPPETTITKGAPDKTDKSKVKFKFESDEAAATFECKKDKKPWKPCSSPTKMKRLDEGKHKFKVRATDAAGNTGPTEKDKFKVVEDD